MSPYPFGAGGFPAEEPEALVRIGLAVAVKRLTQPGLPPMPLYHFYSLDGRGRRIEPALQIDCVDDAAAIAHGDALHKDARLGIWEGSRLVIILSPDAARLTQGPSLI